LDGGISQTGPVFTSVANENHYITVSNSAGCTATGNSFTVSCDCVNGPTLKLGSISGITCVSIPVTISGNTFGGNATTVTIKTNGTGSISTSSLNVSPFVFTYTPAAADGGNVVTITVTTDNPLGAPCAAAAATYTLTVNANPEALNLTGSTICASPGGNGTITSSTSVSGVSYQLFNSGNVPVGAAQPGTLLNGGVLTWSNLPAETGYYVIATNAVNCISPISNLADVATKANPNVTNTPLTQTICSGNSTTLVALTSDVAGTTFSWTATASAGVTGFSTNGTGPIPIQRITNSGAAMGMVVYVITPVSAGCQGPVTNYTVFVNPKPVITDASLTQTICSGSSTTPVIHTSNVAGTIFVWTATATTGVTGFTASGTGTIPSQTIANSGTTQGIVNFAITPIAEGCPGAVINYLLRVNPMPAVTNTSLIQTICSGSNTSLVELTSDVAGTTFAWTATATSGVSGFAVSGTGMIPVQTIVTVGTTQGSVTYAITPTAAGCQGPVTNYTVNVNPAPSSPTQTTDCSLGFGNAVITITNPTGADIDYSLDGGPYQTKTVFAGVANGSHRISVRNGSGCITYGSPFQISCGCVNGPTLELGSNSGSTCGTTPVIVSGNIFSGNATMVTISGNGAGTVTLSSANTSPFAFTYIPAESDAGKIVTLTVITDNPLGSPCAAAAANYTLTVNANPEVLDLTGSSICASPGGNGTITSSASATGVNYQLYNSNRSYVGAVKHGTLESGGVLAWSNLDAGAGYYVIATNATTGCNSPVSSAVNVATTLNPASPIVGSIAQPTCINATGGLVLSSLPSGTWTINPGDVTGTGTSATISSLATGTYNFTVTNGAGCISAASIPVTVNTQPETPSAPIVGAITQPTCADANGRVVLNGLPSGSWTINPGAVTGTGTSTTISSLATGTYNFTVTNGAGCISAASIPVTVNTQPETPSAPIVGAISQPTCIVATGSVVMSGLPSGSWTINPGVITGTGISTTISSLATGTYNFTVTNGADCTSAASAPVSINPQPETPKAPTVGTITQPTCNNSSGSLVMNGLPSGIWTVNPGAVTGTGISKTISLPAAGTYHFTVTNATGCVSGVSATVLINAKPNCVPVAVNDKDTTLQDIPKYIPVTLNDYDPDGTIDAGTVDLDPSIPGIQTTFSVSGQGSYSVNNTGVVTFTPAAGFYGITTPVNYTVNDNSGATSNIAAITVIVIHVNHPPVIDLPDVTTFNNNPVTICSPISDPDIADTFTATVCSNPKNGTASSPVISSDGKNVCIVYTPGLNFNGKDSICVTVCDQGGLCGSSTSVITVTSISLETASKPVTCAGSKDGTIDLTVIGGAPPYIYQWTGPGAFKAITKNLTALAGGTYIVKVTDANGAVKTASVKVEESDALLNLTAIPTAVVQTMSIDQTVILGVNPGSITLTVTGGSAPFTYTWSGPGDYSANSEDITDLQGGTYAVHVSDANGCVVTTSAKVDVQIVLAEDQTCVVSVPNVFTPNGDGINDYFEISCLYNYADAEIEIFNRNGNLLFKRSHYGNTDYWGSKEKAFWNGRSENSLNFMGSELPVGTYYYILKLGNGKVLTGFVFLAR